MSRNPTEEEEKDEDEQKKNSGIKKGVAGGFSSLLEGVQDNVMFMSQDYRVVNEKVVESSGAI